ncbi:MAG TPA: peptidase M23 [Micromonosporaceae bacterium]|nr:peptidase M23 [Micromonosporaceae bacterium]
MYLKKLAVLLVAAGAFVAVDASPAIAAPNFKAPFPCGQTWTYDHHSAEVRLALDFIRTDGGATAGTPNLASAAGTAYRYYQAGGAGNYIVIDHGAGWKTYYFHLAAFSVANGAWVAQGQQIGTTGSTGNSSGPHIHYEQLYNGVGQTIHINGVSLAPYPGQYYQKYLTSDNGCTPGGWTSTVDNATADRFSASANWGTSSYSPQRYGADYRFANPQSISDAAWYRFAVPATGNYRVDVWCPALPGYSTAAPHIVVTTGGNQVVNVDQRVNGGQWRSIGTFSLAGGDYNAVAVSRWTSGTGLVIADAIRLTRV